MDDIETFGEWLLSLVFLILVLGIGGEVVVRFLSLFF